MLEIIRSQNAATPISAQLGSMKEFHRNHVRSIELEKKGRERRVKKENKEVCKCFAPFVRLHYCGCPAVKKSCPIHGNHRHRGVKDEKGEPEKNMIISFHPSSKTERLFQPVKTLLAQCAPETKVNLQYYSPKSTTSKESIRHQQIQTKWEDEKRVLNNSVFVEKTKSFVADKTNKMKKLKQCFHSPCNSIVHKSFSQTSVREKFKEIFGEERKNMAPEKPPDDPNFTWFSNQLDFKDWEKLSTEKTDSDFLTVTQQTKNNLINHKIFEIKHKKGMNDYPFFKLPEQPSQLVFSSFGFDRPMQKSQVNSDRQEKRQFVKNSPPSEKSREQATKHRKEEELSSSENLHTSSSSSVFFTPFILVPAAAEDKSKDKSYCGMEVASKGHGDGRKVCAVQETQTPSMQSEKELNVSFAGESKTTSVLLQTDADMHSGGSVTPEWYLRPLEVAESFTTRGTQTDESLFRLDKCVGDSTRLSELSSGYFAPVDKNQGCEYHVQGTQTSTSPTDSRGIPAEEVQTSSSRRREKGGKDSANTTTYTMTTMDKVVQTESCKVVEVKRLWSFKVSKSHASPKVSNKTTQAIGSRSESLEEVSEFIDLDSSNVTFVVKPFDNQESDQAIDKVSKAWWGKSSSDSQLYVSSKCSCLKPEYVIPFPQSCSCNHSETTHYSSKCCEKSFKEKGSCKDAKVLTPKHRADKSLGANDGSQRSYKRAEKALGTDSRYCIPPEVLGKADKALGTDSGIMKMSRKVDKALGTENEVPGTSRRSAARGDKADKSPRKVEPERGEQTSIKDECFPNTPLSDLSELTKIIQEFFEKTNKGTWRTCPCESSGAEKKTERTTSDSRKSKKEYVDHAVGAHTVHEKKVDSEAMTDAPKKPKREFANAETEAASASKGVSDRSGNHPQTDRVKIRRSVLLDENEPKTRFICSVCAREISTYSMNVATNTENPQTSPRGKEKVASVSTEVNEIVKIKTFKAVQSLDNPKRLTSAPEPTARDQDSDAKEGSSKPQRDSSRSYIPTAKHGINISARNPQISRRDSEKRTTTITTSTLKNCICEHKHDICTKESCSRRNVNNTPTTSRTAPPAKTDRPGTGPTKSSKTEKRDNQRRSSESHYPVIIKSPWPREFIWNMTGRSHSSIPEEWEGEALQRETPAGERSKPEFEKQYFVLGSANSQELQMGDRIVFPNKAGFMLIPSLSASSVDSFKKLSQLEKVREPNELQGAVPPEGLNEPSDLSSTKSCRLAPLRVECDDKLFECRVCKSLTLLKTDKDGLVFHWRHGLLMCRPTGMQQPNSTTWRTRREDFESVQRNESSMQNLDELFEESSHFTDRSDSPSPYELMPEEAGETSEEEPDSRRPSNEDALKLNDIFYSNAAVSSKSFNKVWSEDYTKKE